ncbi:Uncharacterised protein [Serratia liquefaciens]|nr:Uncharacterised protein [Serratia liquefaciens]
MGGGKAFTVVLKSQSTPSGVLCDKTILCDYFSSGKA